MTLQVGDSAPDFSMPTVSGGTVSLGDLRGKKVVLYFYPKDDTPGCTIEACSFRDNLPTFQGVNAEIIGVSRDNTESHQRFRDKYGLNFTLASDDSGQVTEDYGVWREKNMYGKTFMGIQRSTFLIDENGNIAKIWPTVSVEGHSQEVLAAINGEEAPAPAAAPAAAKPKAAPKPKKAAAPKAAAKKAAPKKVAAKAAKKPAAKKAAAKKKPAKKAAPKKKVAAKAAKKPAKKAAAKKTTARKTAARKTAKKATAKRAPAKKAKKPAKRATARTAARRAAARRPARRTTAARRRR